MTEATTTTRPARMAEVERGICESLIESGFAQQDGDIDGGTPLIGGTVCERPEPTTSMPS